MSANHPSPRGQLCIWTDVEPEHELDFNRWYDREHMQERVAIPGFQSARRFKALGASARPYLALYDTDDIGVFTSAAYRHAFANQTEWSLRNFARMRNNQRRVGRLAIEIGDGEGGALALFVVPPGSVDAAAWREPLARAAVADHVIRASLLQTDAGLSTPLKPDAVPAPADGLVMIEATRADVAQAQAQALARDLRLPSAETFVFQTLWRLGA
jgi:hypothetical protein